MTELQTSLDVEARNDNKKVEGWLIWKNERKREYELKREAIMHSSPPPPDGQPRGLNIGDSTGRKGRKLAMMQQTEQWICLVEEVEQRLPMNLRLLLKLKQEYKIGVRGRPIRWEIAWELSKQLSAIQKKDRSISPDTVDEWWERVVEYTVRLAAKKNLL